MDSCRVRNAPLLPPELHGGRGDGERGARAGVRGGAKGNYEILSGLRQ